MGRASLSNFRVGPWIVQPDLNMIAQSGRSVSLEPRVMDLLVYLANHPSRTTSKEELIEEVWGGAFVSEGVVTKTVSTLRSALEDDVRNPRYLVTVPRRGYRWIAPVEWLDAPTASGEESDEERSLMRRLVVAGSILLLAAAVLAISLSRRRPDVPPSGGQPQIDRLAILPFEGGESLPDDRMHLPASLQDEVTHRLAGFKRPRLILVPERERSRRSLVEIGKRTDADAFLEGVVDVYEGSLEVRVDLRGTTGRELLWSRRWRQPLTGASGIDRVIAGSVVEETRRELDRLERRRLLAGATVDPEAHRIYLQARWLWNRRGIEDMNRAAELFEEATRRDPTFADAFAGLAMCEITRGSYSILSSDTAWARAERAARRALELDPGSAEARTAVGLVRLQRDWNFDGAIGDYREALRVSPGPTPARQLLAEALSIVGRHEEATRTIEEAIDLEPYSPLLLAVRGIVLWAADRPGEALESLNEALEFDPRFSWVHRYRAYAFLSLGREDEAARARWEEIRARGEPPERLAILDEMIREEGYRGALRWDLALLERRPEPVTGDAWERAESLAGLGRTDEALVWLEEAVEERGEFLLHRRRTDSIDPIRGHPRYVTLLAEHGLEP